MISYVDPLLFSVIFSHHLLVYFSFERSSKPYELKPKSTRESVDLWMPASLHQSLDDDRAHMHKSKGKITRGQCISTRGMAIPSAILYLEIELKY